MRLSVFVALGAVLAFASATDVISPKLSARLQSCGDGEMVPVVVWLGDPPGWAQRREEIMSMPAGRARIRATVEALKEFYFSYAEPVLRIVDRYESQGDVVFGRHLWGAFSFSMRATKDAIYAVSGHPRVRAVFLDEPIKARFVLPYDPTNPFSRDIWLSKRPAVPDAVSCMSNAWQVTKIDADDAWAMGYDGSGVVVAIFDTGVDYTHPDLSGRMWHNPDDPIDGSDNDGNGFVDDYYGADFYDGDGDPMDNPSSIHHGTMCAGMVAGDGTSGTTTGSAPGATIMAIRVGDGSNFVSGSDEVAAFQYALEHGAQVGSMSYGSYPTNSVKDYYRYVMNNTFGTAGVVICVAAGNGDGSGGHYSVPYDISSPADVPPPWYRHADSSPPGPVIAVGATTTSDAWASWASRGPTQWDFTGYYGSWHDYPAADRLMKPDVAAPGEWVITTEYGGGYTYTDGTSFSCPLTAGVVALMLSKNASLTPLEIDSILEATAKDVDDPGRDNYTGAGRVDADSALMLVSGKALVVDSVRIDDAGTGDGDGNIDPGETANFVIFLRNAATQPAPGVTLTLTSVTNPHVTIVDGSSSYGTIAAGETRSNTADHIVLSVSPTARYTEYCKCYVTLADAEGYSKPDSFAFRVGVYPLVFRYQDTLATLLLGFTDFGTIGYPTFGNLAWPWPSDSTNLLYVGEVMVGESDAYVADGMEEFWPFDTIEFIYGGSVGDVEAFTTYIDTTNTYQIYQYSYSWRSAPNNDFVIFFFRIHNFGSTTISNALAGFYCDFDIPPYDTNYAQLSSSDEWGYMYHSASGKYVGVVALDGFVRGSVVDNPTYVYGSDVGGMGWTDQVKWNFLSGTYSQSSGTSPSDYSLILAFGPFTIEPGGYESFAAAVVAGGGLSDFQNNATQAKDVYSVYSAAMGCGGAKPRDVVLFGVYPNPFNGVAEVRVALAAPKRVSVDVVDICGRVVQSFGELDLAAGMHRLAWRCDEGLPSGMYLVRLRAGDETLLRRAFLVK